MICLARGRSCCAAPDAIRDTGMGVSRIVSYNDMEFYAVIPLLEEEL